MPSSATCRPHRFAGPVALAAALAVTISPDVAAADEASQPVAQTGFTTASAPLAEAGAVRLVSKQASGQAPDRLVNGTDVGRRALVVAFTTTSGGMLAGESDDTLPQQVYLSDRRTGANVRVSSSPTGAVGDDNSSFPAVTPDGSVVVYASQANNLLAEPTTDGQQDIYRYDAATGLNEVVSVARDGGQANGYSSGPSVSRTGAKVVFGSSSSDLVAGDDAGWDVFLRGANMSRTREVTVGYDGGPANGESGSSEISLDGDWIALDSRASNLVVGDTNETNDVFRYDIASRQMEIVSVAADGGPANGGSSTPSISADGERIAFSSDATNLTDDDLFPGPTRTFVRDLSTGTTELVDQSTAGEPANTGSQEPSISGDGTLVAFWSSASNLVPDDTRFSDVFVRDTSTGTTVLGTRAKDGAPANRGGSSPAMSPDGAWLGFESGSKNLVRQPLHLVGVAMAKRLA